MDGVDHFMYRGSTASSKGFSGGPVFSTRKANTLLGICKCGLKQNEVETFTGIIPYTLIQKCIDYIGLSNISENGKKDF